jgi:hypothetical protein
MNIALYKARKKRIVDMMVEVQDSLGGYVGKDEDHLDPLKEIDLTTLDDMPIYNNGALRIPFRGSSSYDGTIVIKQARPLPLKVLSITCFVETGD